MIIRGSFVAIRVQKEKMSHFCFFPFLTLNPLALFTTSAHLFCASTRTTTRFDASRNISFKYIIPPILPAYRHETTSQVWMLFNNLYHIVHIDVYSEDKHHGLASRTHVVGRLQAPKVSTRNICIPKEMRIGASDLHFSDFAEAITLLCNSKSLLEAVKATKDNIGMMS